MENRVIITKMSIKKGVIELLEVSLVDEDLKPIRKISLNESLAVALRGSVIELNLDHLKKDF